MKRNWNFIIGIGYICFMVGFAYSDVGNSYEGGTYTWRLIPTVLLALSVPFYAGYQAGKKDK